MFRIHPMRTAFALVAGACIACMPSISAAADTPPTGNYPNRPVRVVVPYPPGAGTDFTAREVGAAFTAALGQQYVIDNRPGAAATLGHAIASKAAADGYTLLLGTTGGLVSGPALLGNRIPYDPLKDFTTVGLATYVPYSLVMGAHLPAQNVKELIALAKNSAKPLTLASPGVGTPNHIGGAQLMTLAGIELVHVPYKGAAFSVADLVAGRVDLLVVGLQTVLPLHRAGKVRILGIGHHQRLKAYPEFATIAETVPGYYNTGWWGIAGPAGIPKPTVERLNAIMVKALATPEILQRFERNGLEVATSTPEGYLELIRSDLQSWRKLIKEAKISVDVLP